MRTLRTAPGARFFVATLRSLAQRKRGSKRDVTMFQPQYGLTLERKQFLFKHSVMLY